MKIIEDVNDEAFQFGKTKKKSMEWQLRDNDGDGVLNTNDCSPYNAKKQGILHNVGAFVTKRLGAKDTAARIEQRGKESDEAKEEMRKFEKEKIAEARKEIIETRQQAKVDKQKARIETKIQAIKDRPKRQAEARERLKQAVTNLGSKPFGHHQQSKTGNMNRNILAPLGQMNDMMTGGNQPAPNPMAEFMPGNGGSGFGGGNPMAEFMPKQAQVKKRKGKSKKRKGKVRKSLKKSVKTVTKKRAKPFVVVNGKKYYRG